MQEFVDAIKKHIGPKQTLVFAGGLAATQSPYPAVYTAGYLTACAVPLVAFVTKLIGGVGHWIYVAGGAGFVASIVGLMLGSWAYGAIDVHGLEQGHALDRCVRLIAPTLVIGWVLGITTEAVQSIPLAIHLVFRAEQPLSVSRGIGILIGWLLTLALFVAAVAFCKSITDDMVASNLSSTRQGNVQAWQAAAILAPFSVALSFCLLRVHGLPSRRALQIAGNTALSWLLIGGTLLWLFGSWELGRTPTRENGVAPGLGFGAASLLLVMYFSATLPPLLIARREVARTAWT